MYVQLNIGYIGVIEDKEKVAELKEKYRLGDIVTFKVSGFDSFRKRYFLDLSEKQSDNNNYYNNKYNKAHTLLNVEEKCFYPKSFLIQNNMMNNNNNNQVNNYYNSNYLEAKKYNYTAKLNAQIENNNSNIIIYKHDYDNENEDSEYDYGLKRIGK